MAMELAVEKTEASTVESITITTTPERIEELKANAEKYRLAGADVIGGEVIVSDASAMVADREGLKSLKAFLMKEVVKQRTNLDKEHKKIKEDAWAECKRIDAWKNENLKLLEEIEKPLRALEKAVESELDRLAKAEADKLFAARRQLLIDVGAEEHHLDESMIRRMDNDAFEKHVIFCSAEKKRKFQEEQDRARIAEEQRLERERLEEESRIRQAAMKAENDRLLALQKELEAQRAEQERLAKIESDRIQAERKAQEELLQKQRDELESLRQAQMKAAEDAKNSEERRQQEIRDKLADQQRELEERARIQREEESRIEAEKLAFEHEREMSETRAIVQKMQSDSDEVLKPYESMVVKLPVQEWHKAAGDAIYEWIRGFETNTDEFDSEYADDRILEIAEIIHAHDPAID